MSGASKSFTRLEKGTALNRHLGARPAAEERCAQIRECGVIGPHQVVQRNRLKALVRRVDPEMILEVLTDVRRILDYVDIETTESLRRSNAGTHEQ